MTSNRTTPAARSSNRISLPIQVAVHGRRKNETEFREDTTTLLVNSSGALVPLASDVSLGDAIRVVNKSTQCEQECRVVFLGKDERGGRRAGIAFRSPVSNFWRTNRRENRAAKRIRVKVRGVDPDGHPFIQSAYSIDVSRHGARLDGIGYLTQPGQTIEVRRLWRSARFRVMWVGTVGAPEAGQAGTRSLEPNKKLWGGNLP